MIDITKYSELAAEVKRELEEFIEGEFGHIPIVNETDWATPDWTIISYENNKISTFYNIIEREIFIDNIEVKIAGINNVITPKQSRGKGYASKILRETEYFIFDDLKSELGVLLCADELKPFYERLNWYKIDCPVYFEQSDGINLWKANVMLLSKGENIQPNEIRLNGLPW